jgi:hypothetical protein
MFSRHRWAKKMSEMTEQLNVLKAILDVLVQVNSQKDFIGKTEIDSRLRWAAKSTADKIHQLSNLNA